MTDEQAASDPEQERALGKMSFMEHLGELRTRIMWALGSASVGLVIAFFVTDPAMRFISKPLAKLNTVHRRRHVRRAAGSQHVAHHLWWPQRDSHTGLVIPFEGFALAA